MSAPNCIPQRTGKLDDGLGTGAVKVGAQVDWADVASGTRKPVCKSASKKTQALAMIRDVLMNALVSAKVPNLKEQSIHARR